MRKPEIERAFEMYNAVLFGGRLQLPAIMVRRMIDCARWYEPEPEWADSDKPHYGLGLLVMSMSADHKGTWRATLLHEMVHMAVPGDEADHHGPVFTAECNRVGALIGIEHVEIEDSWCWPSHHLNLEPYETNILDD
jgi:hypothetical protein